MTAYALHGRDNDSNMCGSSDRLFDEVAGIPICLVCGYKTDLYFVNPSFRVKRRVFDLSSTYDCYNIASLKFKEACQRLNLKGFEFISLQSDSEFFVIKPTSLTSFDSASRKTRFESFCAACGFHKAVAGATPAFLLTEPESDLSATDVVFGSGNSRGRMLIATEHAKKLLIAERLTGLEFEATMHNNSFQGCPTVRLRLPPGTLNSNFRPQERSRMFIEDIEKHHIDIAEALIRKITPNASLADELVQKFLSLLQEHQEDSEDFVSLLDDVSEATDWESTYYVDWKDIDSFTHCVTKLAMCWGINLTLTGITPNHGVPDLIRIAHAELASSGLGLWGWNTQGDSFSGWIGRLSDTSFFEQASEVLEAQICPVGADF